MSPINGQASASIGGRTFDLTAKITRAAGDEGVLFATGSENSGISVFVQNDRFVVDYNAFDDHTIVESSIEVPEGDSVLTAHFRRLGRHGEVEIKINNTSAGTVALPLYMRMISSSAASVGEDHGSPISQRYQAPFAFSGVLHELAIQLIEYKRPADAQAAEARAEMSRQ